MERIGFTCFGFSAEYSQNLTQVYYRVAGAGPTERKRPLLQISAS